MMSKLIIDGFDNDELVAYLDASPTKKFIMELNYAYGLKVIGIYKSTETYTKNPDDFYLGYESNGLGVCNVWTEKDIGGSIKYYLRTPYYNKDRGNSRSDKETIFSCKLSSMMATLKRQKIILSSDEVLVNLFVNIENARIGYASSFGDIYKRIHDVNVDDIHILLSKVLDGKDVEGVTLDLNNCKLALDKYNKANTIRLESENESKRFYENPFYFIGSTGGSGDDLIIGVFKRKSGMERINFRDGGGGGNTQEYEVIKPLKRFKDFDTSEYSHLKGLLTMLKVSTEDKVQRYKHMIPLDNTIVIKDLDMQVVNFYNSNANTQSFYKFNAVLTPYGDA